MFLDSDTSVVNAQDSHTPNPFINTPNLHRVLMIKKGCVRGSSRKVCQWCAVASALGSSQADAAVA